MPRVASTYVVGFTGTPGSWRAVAYAVGLARRHSAASRLVIVHAMSPAERFAVWPEVVPMARLANDHCHDELREALGPVLSDSGVAWQLWAKVGHPYAVLSCVADEQQADAVIIGAARRPCRWSRSISARLVALARYPVIVVP